MTLKTRATVRVLQAAEPLRSVLGVRAGGRPRDGKCAVGNLAQGFATTMRGYAYT